jgi:hypothetical protein
VTEGLVGFVEPGAEGEGAETADDREQVVVIESQRGLIGRVLERSQVRNLQAAPRTDLHVEVQAEARLKIEFQVAGL